MNSKKFLIVQIICSILWVILGIVNLILKNTVFGIIDLVLFAIYLGLFIYYYCKKNNNK